MSLNYANVSSDDVNVVVERYPSRPIPARRYNIQQIPGRSGDLLFDEGAYDNVEQIYEIYIRQTSAETFQKSCRMAAEWLLLPVGYQKLFDSYDPDTYRLGFFSGPSDVENALNQMGRTTIAFNCKPYRYLFSGETAQTFSSNGSISNPTGVASRPEIVIHGSGAGVLGVGSYTVSISAIDDGMVLDCEAMDCYNGGNNRNNLITLSPAFEYPQLLPGANAITISGGITSIELTPNWRTL